MKDFLVQQLGLMSYQSAWELQKSLFEKIVRSKAGGHNYAGMNYLLLTEHPHVYTFGKRGKEEHLLLNGDNLNQKGIQVFRINRGGDITYHGPGQVVVYPIIDLGQFFTDVRKYLNYIEESIIRTLADYGILAERSVGEAGVWVKDESGRLNKICAIGLRMSRWVSMHGLALNVNTDLEYFNYIVPCGIRDKGVTSMQKELGVNLNEKEVTEKFLAHFQKIFDANLIKTCEC